MKVLVVSMKYDYGDPERGLSYGEYYLEKPLGQIVDTVLSYDYMSMIQSMGRERMNQDLLSTIQRERPAVTIFVPYGDQFIPEVIDEINRHTISIGYYFDDIWRIEYSRFWADHYTYVTTSDVNGVKRWQDIGCSNFIYSPFACSQEMFRRKDCVKKYDVSFVGQYHPYRAWYLRRLRKAGFNVHAWGYGWPAGRLDMEAMVDVFCESRINLNLSNNDSWDVRYIFSLTRSVKETLRVGKSIILAPVKKDAKIREMVKARHFEINSCGGFQLSYYVEGLERHYKIGEEIAIYESIEEIVDKIHYYLKYEEEREGIALRGYERTQRDHSVRQRFMHLFKEIGFEKCLKN